MHLGRNGRVVCKHGALRGTTLLAPADDQHVVHNEDASDGVRPLFILLPGAVRGAPELCVVGTVALSVQDTLSFPDSGQVQLGVEFDPHIQDPGGSWSMLVNPW